MLVLDIKRTKEDFIKKKGKSSEYTKDGYSFIFKGLERYADSHNVRVNTFSIKELKKSLQKIRGVLEA